MKTKNMKTKTILFTLDLYEIGGVASFVKQYTDVLRQCGCKIIILGTAGNIKKPEYYFPGCRVVTVPGMLSGNFIEKIAGLYSYFLTLNEIYLNNRVDIIHFSLTLSTFCSLTHFKTWPLKKIITFYGASDLETKSSVERNKSIRFEISCFIKKHCQYLCLKMSNTIVAFSKYAESVIVNHFSSNFYKKIVVIPGYIGDKEIKNYSISNRTKLNNQITIVNFGRAEKRKGIEVLLASMKLCVEKGLNLQLYIASPVDYYIWGKYLSVYEDLNLFTHVHFLHSLNRDQINKILLGADLFIMPSQGLETFGMSLIEALSRGVPAIGTPIGAISEILNNVDRKLISKGKTAKNLADKIIWFSKLSRKEIMMLKVKSIKCVKNNYSQEAVSQKIISLYK